MKQKTIINYSRVSVSKIKSIKGLADVLRSCIAEEENVYKIKLAIHPLDDKVRDVFVYMYIERHNTFNLSSTSFLTHIVRQEGHVKDAQDACTNFVNFPSPIDSDMGFNDPKCKKQMMKTLRSIINSWIGLIKEESELEDTFVKFNLELYTRFIEEQCEVDENMDLGEDKNEQ